MEFIIETHGYLVVLIPFRECRLLGGME